ncbi:glycosyltransferase [Bifidobacterium olomucense]|uniref:Capsular polysaccharide biosynthesis protein n=1 Tax=Bifidobacterium olomucense TaxID=2675324 RepID=A0A7Y0HVY0_9BIFI|nr:glycosyltransferase [Bifidobacterium sp. DSM 109959]NMM97696.1 capsular polysaccharide biosynthesis protein [Bifidobacterium sp. DSM 109959]
MTLVKMWYRLVGLLTKLLYRLIYGRKIRWGKAVHMRHGFRATVDGDGRIVIGDDVFFNNGCALHAMREIRIGAGTVFGENVLVYDHNHRFSEPQMSFKDQGYSIDPVRIGRHCWIGSNATILKGVTIGDNCVVGAGCVIDHSIPSGSLVKLSKQNVIERIAFSAPIAEAGEQANGADAASHGAGPVRVLVLDTVMDRGGAETMTMNYLRHMDRSKVVYDVLVNRPWRGAYEDEFEELGGRVWRMCPMYPQSFARYKREFRAFLKQHPEYRIIHSNLEERSYFPLRIAAEEGIPVRIAHAHNRPRGVDAKLVFREYFRLRLRLGKYATHQFACGREAGEWLFGRARRSQMTLLHNAIDTAQYRYDPDIAAQVRRELGVEDSEMLVVGHVGRFFPQKNHTFLLDVFEAVHRMHPNSVLWLIGGGEQDDRLKHEMRRKAERLGIADAVRFLGVRSDVPRLMQGMDVFVLPSLYEGLPVTMIEAQTAGLPCVISSAVPAECDVTGRVRSLALCEPADRWAQVILDQAGSNKGTSWRIEGASLVTRAGYDIVSNARRMQDFYLKALTEVEGDRDE